MRQSEINAIAHELEFWARFVKSGRFINNWINGDVNPEPTPAGIADLIRPYKDGIALDIGSGVTSVLRGRFAKVVAVDPLAPLYEVVFDYELHGLMPAIGCTGEELLNHFDTDTFDVVHISNALDHCQDPVKVMKNMWQLVRHGGLVIVQGFINEGEKENYQGFHQWNISGSNKGMLIKDKKGRGREFKGDYIEYELPTKKIWFVFTRKKEKK